MKFNILMQASYNSKARKGSKKHIPMQTSDNIAGTNIQHNSGLSKGNNLARQGRRGDTKIRKVGGVPSHVNTPEAQAIDSLGPLGEAWVQNVGSGTTNPKTGLPEYAPSWLPKALTPPTTKESWGRLGGQVLGAALGGPIGALAGGHLGKNIGGGTTWKPADGQWGMFGQTKRSKRREAKRNKEKNRAKAFDSFIVGNKDKNVLDDFNNYDDLKKFTTGYKDNAGNTIGMSSDNFDRYIDKYDNRAEQETDATLERNLNEQQLASDTSANKNQEGLFGMLTQASTAGGQTGFSGAGNFQQDFQQDSMMDNMQNASQMDEISRQGLQADAESFKQNQRDDYNDEFWTQMATFDSMKSGT